MAALSAFECVMAPMDIDGGVRVGSVPANAHQLRPQVWIESSLGAVLISSPIYALQCAVREAGYFTVPVMAEPEALKQCGAATVTAWRSER